MTATETNESPKRKIASHEYRNAAGEKVLIDQGVAIHYHSEAGGWDFDFALPGGDADRMLALFGARTLSINETSAARQAGESEHDALIARFAEIANGTWRERAEGVVRGPKYDKDILAQVIVEALGADAKGDANHYRQRLEDKSYYAKIRSKAKIMAAYVAVAGTESDDSDIA